MTAMRETRRGPHVVRGAVALVGVVLLALAALLERDAPWARTA